MMVRTDLGCDVGVERAEHVRIGRRCWQLEYREHLSAAHSTLIQVLPVLPVLLVLWIRKP
jgi:hypothetical protein